MIRWWFRGVFLILEGGERVRRVVGRDGDGVLVFLEPSVRLFLFLPVLLGRPHVLVLRLESMGNSSTPSRWLGCLLPLVWNPRHSPSDVGPVFPWCPFFLLPLLFVTVNRSTYILCNCLSEKL